MENKEVAQLGKEALFDLALTPNIFESTLDLIDL